MAVDTEALTFDTLITTAVHNVRFARHHDGCRCGLFRPATDGYWHSPFCNSSEYIASSALDRILNGRSKETPC